MHTGSVNLKISPQIDLGSKDSVVIIPFIPVLNFFSATLRPSGRIFLYNRNLITTLWTAAGTSICTPG